MSDYRQHQHGRYRIHKKRKTETEKPKALLFMLALTFVELLHLNSLVDDYRSSTRFTQFLSASSISRQFHYIISPDHVGHDILVSMLRTCLSACSKLHPFKVCQVLDRYCQCIPSFPGEGWSFQILALVSVGPVCDLMCGYKGTGAGFLFFLVIVGHR